LDNSVKFLKIPLLQYQIDFGFTPVSDSSNAFSQFRMKLHFCPT
jgi:hypothetical protein